MINKWIVFTSDGIGAPIALKLQQEHKDVVLAQVKDLKTLCNKEELKNYEQEDPESFKRRMSLYKGIVTKKYAEDVIKELLKVKNPEEYFLFFDFNNLFNYSEKLQKMGFNGNFVTQGDHELETNRDKAKDIVKKYYDEVDLVPVYEFKSIEDGIKFLEEDEENSYVLKGYAECCKTVVPRTPNVQMAKIEIIESLRKDKSDYESSGFLLELKIENPLEITPQMVWYNGERVFSDVDIENKTIGSGDTGYQVGAAQSLVVKTKLSDRINEIAFPPITDQMAKRHKGLFVLDCSLLYDCKTDKLYFGEYCSNRFGYDSLFAELSMSRSVAGFFEDIVDCVDPLIREAGVAVRLFNMPNKSPYMYKGNDLLGKRINYKTDDNLYLYDVMKDKEDNMVTCGLGMDLGVVAGYGNSPKHAIAMAYDEVDLISFKDMYFRPRFDFHSHGYKTSIINRLHTLDMINIPVIEEEDGYDGEDYDNSEE